MSVKATTTNELRDMNREGIVLQGCFGAGEEWLKGLNCLLEKEHVFLDENRFEDCFVFEHEGTRCLFFPFGNTQLNVGQFRNWLNKTDEAFQGIVFSDYVEQRLGGFKHSKERERPICASIDECGNVLRILETVSRTLRSNGLDDRVPEMIERIQAVEDYEQAVIIANEYVRFPSDGYKEFDISDDYDDEEVDMEAYMNQMLGGWE